jgi:hypothetical protein
VLFWAVYKGRQPGSYAGNGIIKGVAMKKIDKGMGESRSAQVAGVLIGIGLLCYLIWKLAP